MERGPGKVVSNLLMGLNLLNVNYVNNLDGDINIILQNCNRLTGDLTNCYLGPNISTLPIDNRYLMNYDSYKKIIVPSEWVKKLYTRWIPPEKIIVWPVGIDTERFADKTNYDKEYDFLIYFKKRNFSELNLIINYLDSIKKRYVLIEYGKYSEKYFIDCIEKSEYGIVIDNCESQGIAILEMMSSNLPLLVWDVREWLDRGEIHKCDATSIPFWDERCGEIFYSLDEFEISINKILNKNYSPRKYILEKLTLIKSYEILKNYL